MQSRPFYTRCPELADIKSLVRKHLDPKQPFDDFNQLFVAVDAYCSEHFPAEDHGGWFTPRILGGFRSSHTPPHIIFWVYAVYLHLATGDREPVPFLGGPLDLGGAMAITMAPTDRFQVVDRQGSAHPMTDLLTIIPAITPRTWTADTYGLPELRPEITIIGWHSAAQPFLTAVCSGQLLLEPVSRRVLDPLASLDDDEPRFFTEPVNPSRLQRYRERLTEVFETPLDALSRSSDSARRVIEAYLGVPKPLG